MKRRILRLVLVFVATFSVATAWGASLGWIPVGNAGDGSLEVMIMGSAGPVPPTSVSSSIVDVFPQSAVTLSNVPTSSWTNGCSATSAGMMFGYYDLTSYPNMYTGPYNGGVVPTANLGNLTHLIATKQGVDGVTGRAHVDNYWISTNSPGPDPWVVNGWPEHTWADCTADFMGTNQWKWDFNNVGYTQWNNDGATALFSYGSGSNAKLYDYIPPASAGLPQTALCHGLRLFAESRGYQVAHDGSNYQNYTQKTDNIVAGGFSFLDFQNEIDAGRPVMVQVEGHSMVGMGYDVPTNTIYIHDTWGDYVASMTWGGSYSGMGMQAMTVLQLAPLAGPNIAVTGTHGTWTITSAQFVSPNTLDIDKTANDMGPFDVEIQVTGNLTSIVIDDPVLNNSGKEWPGYRFQLGYWDDQSGEFVASTAGDGLAFDSLASNHTSDVFSNVTLLSEDELYFSGGLVGLGGSVSFVLDIDVPGGSSFDFALRQWAVPEPGSAVLLGFLALMPLAFGRRRGRTRV